MLKRFGFSITDLQNCFVGKEAKPAAHNKFGNDVAFTSSDFHGKSENEKMAKDKEEQESGFQI